LQRRGHATDATALALLAVASCPFTMLLEAMWLLGLSRVRSVGNAC
jgi:hypothetical protein